MKHLLFLVLCALLSLASPALAGDAPAQVSPTVTQGGLSCFTITPPKAKGKIPPSCNELCGAKSAACTGITSLIGPPKSCEDDSILSTCRCCKVKQ